MKMSCRAMMRSAVPQPRFQYSTTLTPATSTSSGVTWLPLTRCRPGDTRVAASCSIVFWM